MPIGKVKWWNKNTGYGFIVWSGGQIFVDSDGVQSEENRPVLEGEQEIEFEVEIGKSGKSNKAMYVRNPGEAVNEELLGGFNGVSPSNQVKIFRGDDLEEVELDINLWLKHHNYKLVSTSFDPNRGESKYCVLVSASRS